MIYFIYIIHVSFLRSLNEDVSDYHIYEHYLSSSENKVWKKIEACAGVEPMTFTIPAQHSTYRANKPTGNWSFCKFYSWQKKFDSW